MKRETLMKRIYLLMSLVVVLASTAGCQKDLKGFIVYAGSAGDGKGTFIFAVTPDGSLRARLTTGERSDAYPAVSPDGKTIVFSSAGQDYKNRLYAVDWNGKNLRLLAETEHNAELASWSPDGTKIAFLDRDSDSDHTTSIYVVQSDAADLKKIISGCTHHSDYQYPPEWSPDGKYILYNKRDERNKADDMPECMYLVRTDGSGEKPFAGHEQTRHDGCFSYDAKYIAYYMEKKEANYNRVDNAGIFKINAEGTHEVYLASGYHPVWSPDNKYIAFTSNDEKFSNCLFIMYPDGTGPGRSEPYYDKYGELTDDVDPIPLQVSFDNSPGVKDPVWSPDGKKLAFVTDTGELKDNTLWVVDISGNSPVAVAKDVLGRSKPSWR